MQGPEDLVIELYTAMSRDPLSVEHYMPPLARRFGHVNIATRDRAESQRFLCDVLGFRVSDTLGEDIRWLRCDRDHHGIALRQADENTMHHYAFELADSGAIQRYADQLARLGKRLIWGPGRHGPGRNLYTYTPDPENAIVEGYADLLSIDDEATYIPIEWDERGDRRSTCGARRRRPTTATTASRSAPRPERSNRHTAMRRAVRTRARAPNPSRARAGRG